MSGNLNLIDNLRSSSKGCAELVTNAYRNSYFNDDKAVASARAGNVIGGGDWAKDRLLPDIIRAAMEKRTVHLRNPHATRHWQHVLDPLAGYLTLAEHLWDAPALSGPYNFGPALDAAASVKEVIELARANFPSAQVRYGKNKEVPHEAGLLVLDNEKARVTLGVNPRWSLARSIENTLEWYRAQQHGADARELCLKDIAEFEDSL